MYLTGISCRSTVRLENLEISEPMGDIFLS
jgi:hypothetical protein